ncbi:hypothetical protein FRC05_003059, partial [Tulasnella sp. 425]
MASAALLNNSIRYDYINAIMGQLPIQDLVSLMATSAAFQAAGQSVMKANIHHLLDTYGLDPDRFRILMRESGMVLGGYTILQLLLRHETGSLSLEVFTVENAPHDGLRRLHDELMRGGYELAGVEDESLGSAKQKARRLRSGIAALKHYTRTGAKGLQSKGRRINVVIADNQVSILTPILRSPTTATMGYLAADSIHHLYPSWTFKRMAWRTTSRLTDFMVPEDTSPTNETAEAITWTYGTRHIRRLTLEEGIVVWQRSGNEPPSGPCGVTCPAVVHSFVDGQALRLVFDSVGKASSCWYTNSSEG